MLCSFLFFSSCREESSTPRCDEEENEIPEPSHLKTCRSFEHICQPRITAAKILTKEVLVALQGIKS